MRPYIDGEGRLGTVRITITKLDRDDRIDIERADGTRASTRFPKKGPVPHDYVHYAVERGFQLDDGFWGKVAAGAHPEALGDMAKAGGHASAKRAETPDPTIAAMVQAERLVECFEADFWSGGGDNVSLRGMALAGWTQSCVAPIEMTDDQIDGVRGQIADFAARWQMLAPGASIMLDWQVGR